LCGAADSERRDAHDGVAGLDLPPEFYEDFEHTACERGADGAVFFRRHNKDGRDFHGGGELDDGGFGGFEAEIFALGLGEGDGAGVGGSAHFGAVVVVMAWAGKEGHG
jgi:hypothetical protein